MEQLTGSGWKRSMTRLFIITLFNLYTEHILRNTRMDKLQAGIKIAEGYADDTTLTAESKKELKSFLMKVKEESEQTRLKYNIKKQRSRHPVPSLNNK